jgi:TPP-dependent pyruvate/acetoin dehydrogenase alpha subunit
MNKKITPEDLIKFEEKIADLFNNKKIKAPIHLYYGNEKEIIKIFKQIKKNDWVFCSWRSHYQCLLKGVPESKIIKNIKRGKSISLCFKKQKIYSSAIVGGQLPIALGVAISIKQKKLKEKVFCFMGDMTSETGIAYECIKYSYYNRLPIHFIIEDNNLSVCTDTRKTWGIKQLTIPKIFGKYIITYKYKSKYPHAGAGARVQF